MTVLGPAATPARAHGAAAALRSRGVREGDRVAVEAAPDDALAWLLGADLLGAATLVVEPRWTARERAAVLADAAPDLVVTGGPPPPDGRVGPVGGAGTAFYLPTTSGSSGRPKVLVRSRDSWLRSFAALGELPGPVLVPGPPSSSLFLFGALHALWCGTAPALRPRLELADARRAGTVHLVPAALVDLLDRVERAPGRGAPRVVVCGGAHLPAPVRERFARLLPDAELVEYYGSAEHSLIAVRRRGEAELRPVDGVDLRVREGVLWVRSPLAFRGHLRGGAVEPAGPWTTVGDRAELTPTGGLRVHGRGTATISCGGRLVSAEEVEAVLRDAPGARDVLVAATPHPRLGSVVTAVVEAGPTLRALRAAARDGLEPAKRPRRWLVVPRLPRTPSGKPARALVGEQLAAGTLRADPLR
ncbi:class I adenylate-forming enzyme family protein [Pseudonocardia humida]|uniref:Acyl--CoA ligase n=1 Tax=Pseudonocardia humida TaxID=2800819 RepID=A0ABT1ABL8_9PSEU|nr:class I adenylate-forming enzyme family protein [Pseudonocardia humida]MCO1660435.1 acyl--CoA ligase [Pseudonocardia humida]